MWHRGEGQPGRIDDDGVRASTALLDQVDPAHPMVRLVKTTAKAEPLRRLPGNFSSTFAASRAIDMRLAARREVEVWAVEDRTWVMLRLQRLSIFLERYGRMRLLSFCCQLRKFQTEVL